MRIALIVAAASNGVIGRNNQLPWYLPNDLKYFKRVTLGKPVVMGRKTFESIGKPLPGRTNIVITRQREWNFEGVKVVNNLEQALALAESVATIDAAEELMVIGGAEIYRAAFESADRLYLTRVHAEVEGDAFFPEVRDTEWRQLAREDFVAEGPNPYDYSCLVLERIR